MAKKKELLPELKSKFSKSEIEYICKCAKMIKWPVDHNSMGISVPHTTIEEAQDNLTVQHLINKFGFYIQSAIEVPENKVFDPVLRSVAPKQDDSVVMPKRTEVWVRKSKKERLYMKSIDKGMYAVAYLNDIRSDSKISEDAIRDLVIIGDLVKDQ